MSRQFEQWLDEYADGINAGAQKQLLQMIAEAIVSARLAAHEVEREECVKIAAGDYQYDLFGNEMRERTADQIQDLIVQRIRDRGKKPGA